jgi:hypothetical protein
VLAMCDSSQTADTLATSTDLNVWSHPDANSSPQGQYGIKTTETGGKYIILINGSTDAAYTIESAHWTSATGAQAVPGDRSTSIATEGSIRISEPKGVAFLDQLVQCCVSLGVDSAHVVYVLKTVFVGENQFQTGDRDDYADSITDISPLTLIMCEITGSFTEAGGNYEMQFVTGGHGATRLPQYSMIGNAMSISAGDSLAITLGRLQDNINSNYEKYFQCVYKQIKSLQGDTQTLLNSLCRVKYVIEVGEDYQDTDGIKYTVTNQPQQYKSSAGCADAAQLTFPPPTSIETAISTIMLMSPQVQADMAVGDTSTGIKYEHKIHSALVSVPTETGIDYTVYYRVERFKTPKSIVYNPAFQVLQGDKSKAQLENDPEYLKLKRNIIEFDYIYTGKNIDILELDMKVNMGLAYLQTATIANTFKSQLERGANRMMQPSSADVNSYLARFGEVVKTPVFFGSQIKASNLINTQNGSHAIQSAYTLTKHSSFEVTDASMRITGNAELLGSTNKTSSPEYVVQSATRSTEPTPADNQSGFADWTHSPAYVKVNIMMPRNNDDFSLFTGRSINGTDESQDYARPFWYDGYYYVVGIDHSFDDGEFTQTLQMISLPKASSFQATKDQNQDEVNLNDGVGTCFDNAIGDTAPSQPAGPVVPVVPPSGDTTPTNRDDAKTVNTSPTGNDPSVVKGWDEASPEVKAAITDASNRYGVNIVTMAQFAAQESSFKPTAKAPTSNATGLYQFVTSTWQHLVKQGKVFGVNSITPDTRTNPRDNANGGAALLRDNGLQIGSTDPGDLYLAHFLGLGTALLVIHADDATGGNELVLTTLGEKIFSKIAPANPTIIKPNTTVGYLRSWAAKTMAAQLKGGIAVARQKTPIPPAGAAGAPGASYASTDPQDAPRTASTAVAAQQNAATQTGTGSPCTAGPVKPQDTAPATTQHDQ